MKTAHELTYSLGGNWRNDRGQAPCPICQSERRHGQTALSIAEADGRILVHCFKSGCSFAEIAEAASLPIDRAQVDFDSAQLHDQKRERYAADKLRKARDLWNVTKPITGTHGEAYLRGRGITCPMSDSLRWVPDLFHGPSMAWAAAMVADVSSGGVHRTYFDKKGRRLAKSAKMMLGPCAGGAVRLSDSLGGPLVVCEGVETGLSLLSSLLTIPATVWATLSTSGMKSVTLPSGSSRLIIATDGDEPGREAGNKLATRAAALGWQVDLMPAPDGQDWNDVLQSEVAV